MVVNCNCVGCFIRHYFFTLLWKPDYVSININNETKKQNNIHQFSEALTLKPIKLILIYFNYDIYLSPKRFCHWKLFQRKNGQERRKCRCHHRNKVTLQISFRIFHLWGSNFLINAIYQCFVKISILILFIWF